MIPRLIRTFVIHRYSPNPILFNCLNLTSNPEENLIFFFLLPTDTHLFLNCCSFSTQHRPSRLSCTWGARRHWKDAVWRLRGTACHRQREGGHDPPGAVWFSWLSEWPWTRALTLGAYGSTGLISPDPACEQHRGQGAVNPDWYTGKESFHISAVFT